MIGNSVNYGVWSMENGDVEHLSFTIHKAPYFLNWALSNKIKKNLDQGPFVKGLFAHPQLRPCQGFISLPNFLFDLSFTNLPTSLFSIFRMVLLILYYYLYNNVFLTPLILTHNIHLNTICSTLILYLPLQDPYTDFTLNFVSKKVGKLMKIGGSS